MKLSPMTKLAQICATNLERMGRDQLALDHKILMLEAQLAFAKSERTDLETALRLMFQLQEKVPETAHEDYIQWLGHVRADKEMRARQDDKMCATAVYKVK
jgi:hypothetical protein